MGRGHGKSNIITKLLSLPYNFFVGSTIQKDVLFPTLICMVFKSEHNLQILFKEMSTELIVEFLASKIESYNPQNHITFPSEDIQLDADYVMHGKEKLSQSISISSAPNSVNSVKLKPSAYHNFDLANRFCVELWDEAIEYFKSKA